MTSYDHYIEAVKSQNYEAVKAGLANEDISASAHDKFEKCALEYAIDLEDTILLSLLVESKRFDLEKAACKSLKGLLPPIRYAAITGKFEATKFLLRLQENTDMIELYFMAAYGGNLKIIKWLIDAELVDPHARSSDDCNVLIYAARHEEVFSYLVDVVHVDPQSIFNGCECTLGHVAARFGQVGILKRFLDDGGDINKKNEFGITPIHLALDRKNLEAVKFLVANGANIYNIGNEGYNTLEIAMIAESEEFLEALNIDENREMLPEDCLWPMAEKYYYRIYDQWQERFYKYFLHLLPESYIKDDIVTNLIPMLISLSHPEYLEKPYKMVIQTGYECEDFVYNSIFHAARSESLDTLKEVLRLYESHGIKFLSQEESKKLFEKCLLKSLIQSKLDFAKFWMDEKGVSIKKTEFVEDERALAFLLSKGYELNDEQKEKAERSLSTYKQFEEAERAKNFDTESVDSQLVGLDGVESEKRVRALLLNMIEKQIYYGVKHILDKWKPSTKVADYHSYPVNVAAKIGCLEIARILYEYGFSVNAFDSAKTDSFVLALKAKHYEFAKYLVLRGLILNLKLYSENEYAFVLATLKYPCEELALWIYNFGAYLPIYYCTENEATFLHLAAAANMPTLVKAIEEENFMLNFERDQKGALPCHYAFRYASFDVVVACLEYYRKIAILCPDNELLLPLGEAVTKNQYRFLLELRKHWPLMDDYIDFWEEGTFKTLYAKYKPIFCACGLFEDKRWKLLKLGACQCCSQNFNDSDQIWIFPCGVPVHASCLQFQSPECPDCGRGPCLFIIKDS